ncbi:MAG: hypothetical protein Kow00111_10040 [Thermincola ferriacetica]
MRRAKILLLLAAVLLVAVIAVGCSGAKETGQSGEKGALTLKIGATPVPHKEILEFAKPLLKEKGVDLEIVEFTDYVLPNKALASGELDANYFQHIPYLEEFSKENNLDLTYTTKVHFEPMGIYPGKVKSLDQVKEGAQIAVPNDVTNEARALLLLEKAGLLKIKPGAGLKATKKTL